MAAVAHRRDGGIHALALGAALALHVGLAALVTEMAMSGGGGDGPGASEFDTSKMQVVEATLVKQGVAPQKQPTRETIAPVQPDQAEKITTNSKAPIVKPPPDKPKADPRAKIDPLAAAQARARAMAGQDAVPQGDAKPTAATGDANGSPWGDAAIAQGDPYLAELKGRLHTAWTVNNLQFPDDKLAKLTAVMCLKLSEDGRIGEHGFKKRSGSSAFDGTVNEAIAKFNESQDDSQNHDKLKPPPAHLKQVLADTGVCFKFPGASKSGGTPDAPATETP